MDITKTVEYKGYTIKICLDDDSMNPRNDDNFGKMVCFHQRYSLGDKHSLTIDEAKELVRKKGFISLPLYLYDHSGITMSTEHTYPYNDRWDAGQVGFIYAAPEMIRKEFNVKRITSAIREKALGIMRSEVDTYDQYIRGEVYGYSIDGLDESCWGYIGNKDKGGDTCALEDAKSIIDNLVRDKKR